MAHLSIRWHSAHRLCKCQWGSRARLASGATRHHDHRRPLIPLTADRRATAESEADAPTYQSRSNCATEQSSSVPHGSAAKRTYQLPAVLAVLGIWSLFQFHAPDTHAADVLTQHYDNARLGAVLDETILTTATVNTN